jgi:hypothetical protein
MAAPRDPRISADLTRRLMQTIQEWGKTQGGQSPGQLGEATVEALLKTITGIRLYGELSSSGLSLEKLPELFRKLNSERPIEEEDALLLRLRARRDILLRNLERAVRAF